MGYPKQGGGPRRLAAACAALAALAFTYPASAQLPLQPPDVKLQVQLPLEDGAVGDALPGDVVEETVNQPLPAPVEDVVENSPVAPVREELRRVVSETTGGTGGGTGGSGGSGGSGSGQGTGAQSAGTAQPGGGSTPSGGQSGTTVRTPRRNSARRNSARGNSRRSASRAGAGTPGRDRSATSALARRGAGSRGRDARPEKTAKDSGNPVTKTIGKIVEVVPTIVWVALGALLLIALALGARTLVERRRARALAADREQLLREVGLLERALLPEVPAELGAAAASVAYRPSEGPAAGGDFYDAFELPGDRVVVLVGDVSGHGPEALERTNSTRAGLHACLDAGMSPRAALESVGRRAREDSDGRFITVVVAVHDPAAGTLTYATAGHPPPIVTGPCEHEPLTVLSSPPIGVAFRTGLRETTVPMPSGSLACFFTDGLLEARAGDGMLGRERLAELVAELRPDEQADALLERVIEVADETPDDMAVCVLRAVSGPEVLPPRIEILEVEAEDVDRGVAERFLEACDLPADEVATALEQVRAVAASSGGALVEITLDADGARVCVAAAQPLAPVSASARP
jgi:stage II sporulation SpoE-like protein